MSLKTVAALTLICGVGMGAIASAQQGGQRPEPPFAKIGSEIGLSAAQVEACFPKPEKSGSQAGGRPPRPDMTAVSSCLSKANPSVSKSAVETALKNNAPRQPRG